MDDACSASAAVVAASSEIKPNDRLTRNQLAAALTDIGLPIAPATLAAMAVRGDGPPFQVWGRRPLYSWESSLAWAQGRLNAPRRHQPHGDAAAQHATA
jgi:hypothetical protein